MSTLAIALVLASAVGCAAPEAERTIRGASALVIQTQGSFAVGGTVRSTPGIYNCNTPTTDGQTFHGDHLYAFYQIPQNAKARRSTARVRLDIRRPREVPDFRHQVLREIRHAS